VCLQGMIKGLFIGPKVGRVTKVELEAVLQSGRSANTCGRLTGSWGRTKLIASDSFLPTYGEIFTWRTGPNWLQSGASQPRSGPTGRPVGPSWQGLWPMGST
jgi:hypothetical protein